MDSAFFLQASSVINIIGLVQSITLAITLLLSKRTSQINTLIACLSLVLALAIGNTLLILNSSEGGNALFQLVSNAAAFLIGPIFWLITSLSLRDKLSISQYWPHAIPFFLFLLLSISFGSLPNADDQPQWFGTTLAFIMLWLWNTQILTYLFLSFQKLRACNFKPKSDGYWLKRLLHLFLIISVINFLLALTNRFFISLPEGLTLNITVLLSMVVAVITYKSQKSPITKVTPPHNAQGGTLDAITSLIKKEKLYRQQDLSLTSLAEKVNLPARQLSAMVNNELGKNFNEFVNEYRVKEVISKIDEKTHKQLTILGMAKEAGFKSNSAFYRAFKNHTGYTPSEFIKKTE